VSVVSHGQDAIKPDVVWDYETYGVTYLKFVVEKIQTLMNWIVLWMNIACVSLVVLCL
jgi:hypothetical protein